MSSLSVHAFVLGVEFFDKHILSCFPDSWVQTSDLFNNGDLHIVDFVAPLVEVVACCLVEMLVGNVSLMLRESLQE